MRLQISSMDRFRLEISVQVDSLSWNKSSSQRSKRPCQLMWHVVQGELFDPECDTLPCATPKRHTFIWHCLKLEEKLSQSAKQLLILELL